MSRKGLNIYKRKDGRWEARYIKSRTAQGKPLYGYLYASSYHEARNRLQDVIRLQGNAPNSKEMSKGSVFEFFSIEWLDTFSTSFKESTYIRYRTLIRCYLMPYFQTAKRLKHMVKGMEQLFRLKRFLTFFLFFAVSCITQRLRTYQ